MCGTDQRMRNEALTVCPCLVVHLGKTLLNRSHDSFCPLGLLFHIHLIFHHFLHHTVDAIGLGVDIKPDERIARERFQSFIQHKRVLGGGKHIGKHRT